MHKILIMLIISLSCCLFASKASLASNTLVFGVDDYAPFQTKNPDGSLDGVAVRIVNAMMKKAQISDYRIEMLPWSVAFNQAIYMKNHGVFVVSRTPSRENKFNWIGPIIAEKWYLLGHKQLLPSSKIQAQKQLHPIGALKDYGIVNLLENQGYTVKEYTSGKALVAAINKKEIDLIALSSSTWRDKLGKDAVDFRPIDVYRENGEPKKTLYYIGFGKQTDPKVITKLNMVVKDMRKDKVIKKIYETYRDEIILAKQEQMKQEQINDKSSKK